MKQALLTAHNKKLLMLKANQSYWR